MQTCMMDYSNLSADGKTARPKCYGIGTFEVLSGIERYINNSDFADHEKAAIPVGTYWVTDRPAGSLYYRVHTEAIDHYRNHHSDWFALFSDKTKKDSLNVNGLNRTGFRLRPLNSDGSGVSWGEHPASLPLLPTSAPPVTEPGYILGAGWQWSDGLCPH